MAFTFATFCFIVALITSCFLIFFAVWQIIAFDELKSDYKNPIDQCSNLNPLVLPEYITHFSLTLLFLCSGEWLTFLLNLPLLAYHVKRYKNRPVMSRPGLYDPTTIMNTCNLNYALREGMYKAVFYFASFCYYLIGMTYALSNY